MIKMKKIISVILVLVMAFGFASCSKTGGKSHRNNDDRDRDTEDVDEKSDEYFVIKETKDGLVLDELTEKGKKQKSLVIPAVAKISCTLHDAEVKHVSFESDDDIDIGYFFSCSETIETVELPANLTVLPPFDGCENLKEITIPKGVTEIPAICFYNNQSLKKITFEGDVTVIAGSAFKQCYSLESIVLPDSVTEIGDFAFDKCKSLRTVTLPKGLKVIGLNAFEQTKGGITTIIVPEEMELEKWDKDAFDQVGNQYTVKVVKDSWADIHFEEVFYGDAVKEYA